MLKIWYSLHFLNASFKVKNSRSILVNNKEEALALINEYGPEHYPKQRGQPAPEHGDGGSDDRTSPRDRGEVMAKDYMAICRDVIHIVTEFMARRDRFRVQLKYFASEPAAISVVGHNKAREGADRDQ